jgi:hypothetical protein
MKALVVRQPWASMIAAGSKIIEVRFRRTSHRGDLLIVAGIFQDGLRGADGLPRGVAVARVRLVEDRSYEPGDVAAAGGVPWRPGLRAWVLADCVPLDGPAVRGMPGLFEANCPSEPAQRSRPANCGRLHPQPFCLCGACETARS